MNIIKLEIENFKRIRAFNMEFDPKGGLIVISGDNAQGKSSAIDAMCVLFGGNSYSPQEPLRRGATKGKLLADLGPIKVYKSLTANGWGQLVVESTNGTREARPQEMLNTLWSAVAFDPLSFLRMRPKDRLAEIQRVAGLNFAGHDLARDQLFRERTMVNRNVVQSKSIVDSLRFVAGLPNAPQSSAALIQQLSGIREHNRAVAQWRSEMEQGAQLAARAKVELKSAQQRAEIAMGEELDRHAKRVAELERLSLDEKARHAARNMEIEKAAVAEKDRLDAEVAKHDKTSASAKKWLDTNPAQPESGLPETLADLDETNKKINANVAYKNAAARLAAEQDESDRMTAELAAMDEKKREAIANAKLPVDGLSFSDDDATFNGLPFDQASQAEQLRASCALALAGDKPLKIALVRDGSLLDDRSMKLLADEVARYPGAQLFIERVGTDPESVGTQIIIEDGMVANA